VIASELRSEKVPSSVVILGWNAFDLSDEAASNVLVHAAVNNSHEHP
jgi:hypothetical protein